MDKENTYLRIKKILDLLSDEERIIIFDNYCINCGSKNKKCNCNKH